MSEYTLTFNNKSTNYGNACIYQTSPNFEPDILSLAWFSKAAHPDSKVKFNWTIDYSFVWSEVGELIPGVIFEASAVVPAYLEGNNKITLDYINDAYTFTKVTIDEKKSGSLIIDETKNVPMKQAAVGIGMSGSGTFVKAAQPNMTLAFTPHPKYWIVFGTFEKGEVLDITEMTNVAEIKFPYGVHSMTATLNEDNTFTIN